MSLWDFLLSEWAAAHLSPQSTREYPVTLNGSKALCGRRTHKLLNGNRPNDFCTSPPNHKSSYKNYIQSMDKARTKRLTCKISCEFFFSSFQEEIPLLASCCLLSLLTVHCSGWLTLTKEIWGIFQVKKKQTKNVPRKFSTVDIKIKERIKAIES